ncbi:allophanate hydrolase subunit 1 [uncultured Eubacterium sp.]|uniref:5-oxoprolinase subunit B family protein n=1 Tax=uncultured Eubacterium sp. TaxID=165185 RepID=UPI000E8E80A8|nr:carboxyltransferase domain-containing protein [uncultured Eubacterium sp.]HAT83004.1 allophanate hydrolase [Eubacterium sp.]
MIPEILICGDSAVSVITGNDISLESNRLVLRLMKSFEQDPVKGIIETAPSYRALMIWYDPMIIGYEAICEEILQHAENMPVLDEKEQFVVEVPICYEGDDLAPDLQECADLQGVSVEEVIRIHSGHLYYTYMVGMSPGHPYSARFEEPFNFQRRPVPRLKIPGRSVVVQKNLSDLIPFDQPCGWNIIGTTPLDVTDFRKEDPFLVHEGQWVKYIPVSRSEYDRIREEVENGTYQTVIRQKEAGEEE